MLFRVALIATLAGVAFGASTPHVRSLRADRVNLEERTLGSPTRPLADPLVYSMEEQAHPDQSLRLIASVKYADRSGPEALEEAFWAVSNPKNPRWSQHLPKSTIDQWLAPHPESVNAVTAWITESGGYVTDASVRNGGYVYFSIPASKAEAMLGCEVRWYKHLGLGMRTLRARDGRYSVPSSIAKHVDFVAGLSQFPHWNEEVAMKKSLEEAKKAGKKVGGPDLAVTASFIRSRYGVKDLKGDDNAHGTKMAVSALIGQYFSPTDLEEYLLLFARDGYGIRKTIGTNMPSNPGVEANLDTQIVAGVAPKVYSIFWSIDAAAQDPFLELMTQLANTTDSEIPHALSTSYGGVEAAIPEAYALKIDDEFKAAGVRGISMMFSSGDSAVGCNQDKNLFVPDWPASSPYQSSCGATGMSLPFELGNEIVAAFSGAGFSNKYGRPRYQEKLVDSYLKNPDAKLPPQSFWNATGRAYPDLAALGENAIITYKGEPHAGVGGTSVSAPIINALISLINTKRMDAGKKPLGFLNQFLYGLAEENLDTYFNDVTRGDDPACGTDGFKATRGFDLASGMGTPKANMILEAAMKLP